MYSKFSLAGKKIWVTGGAGYLGSAIVCALDSEQAETVCIDLEGKSKALVDNHALQWTIPISFDLSQSSKIEELVGELVAQHGLPDGVAHLAYASSAGKRLDEISAGEFSRTLDHALTPTFLLCRALGEKMKDRASGSIVLFSSMYGMVAPDPRVYRPPHTPNPIDYGASKAALLQLSRYFAVHYGTAGVRFNCVTPGPFSQPRMQETNPEFVKAIAGKTALGRVGQSLEIVGPTLFLLSDGASFVTGHSLVVDGGWTAW